MELINHPIVGECPNCARELSAGELACPQCHSLVYRAELDTLAQEARALEQQSRNGEAREAWNRSLAMLPHDSKQAEWVREHMRTLELAQATTEGAQGKPQTPAWARRLGPLAPIVLLLAKSKGLLLAIFKLKFLLSFFSFIVIYVGIFGWRFGVGFAMSILIHEMGHFIDIKRRSLPAEMPVFLPGLGAFVKWNSLGVTKRQIAQISLAGPLAGFLAALGCLLLYMYTKDPLWAALARTGAVINLLNLIPVWALDGGQAANALGAMERGAVLAAALALWVYAGSGIFFLIGAGFVWRLFTKDKPAAGDWNACFYFIALLVALGLIVHGIPAEIGRFPG
jgi:Zn-dependent protease